MIRRFTSDRVAAPKGRFCHGTEVPPGARWLYLSGAVPVEQDGSIPADPARQVELCWLNAFALLEEAGMGPKDIVKTTIYLTDAGDVSLYKGIRDRMLAGEEPAATLTVVAARAQPGYRVEIDVVAAAQP